jgi:peptidoglycan hydrolase-like protein with peptidoglycan-binding domain
MKRRKLLMKRICCALSLLLCASLGSARADQTTSAVQQELKDQGFYYGNVTGQKNADTTAALRRYQIRNGLQITGEIDAETLRSLGMGNGRNFATGPSFGRRSPVAKSTPADEDGVGRRIAPEQPANAPPPAAAPPDNAVSDPDELRPATPGVFAGTPYEMAPPDLQRHVIIGAQALLARAGYYRSGVDGDFGAGTAAAVRAFQTRSGLRADGRLNMETLAALGLLPGQHRPRLHPRRRPLLRQPIYRGEWIPD